MLPAINMSLRNIIETTVASRMPFLDNLWRVLRKAAAIIKESCSRRDNYRIAMTQPVEFERIDLSLSELAKVPDVTAQHCRS
jgi:hypothetical protein